MQRRDTDERPTGTGPGITGASGELIENTGGESGIGGTGHDDEAQAQGAHPDERNGPTQQDAMEQAGGVPRPARASGSATGTIGGGGPEEAIPFEEAHDAGRAGGGGAGALGDTPGGVRRAGE
jgi:hypothetical protein